jgi:hypothetical protein
MFDLLRGKLFCFNHTFLYKLGNLELNKVYPVGIEKIGANFLRYLIECKSKDQNMSV